MARSDLQNTAANFDSSHPNPGNIVLDQDDLRRAAQDGTSLKPGDFVRNAPNCRTDSSARTFFPSSESPPSAHGGRTFTDSVSVFGDVLVGQRDERGAGTGAAASFAVPTTNAFYVSPVAARVPLPMRYANYYNDLGPAISDARIKSTDLTGGIERRFSNDWRVSGAPTCSTPNTRVLSPPMVNAAAQAKAPPAPIPTRR